MRKVGFYETMIRNFSPREIHLFLELPASQSTLSERINAYTGCRTRFKNLVQLLDSESIPASDRKSYEDWVA